MKLPAPSRLDLPFIVQCQSLDGRSSSSAQADEVKSVFRPVKMAFPSLAARMKKAGGGLGRGVQAGFESQFLKLAAVATQGEVRQ